MSRQQFAAALRNKSVYHRILFIVKLRSLMLYFSSTLFFMTACLFLLLQPDIKITSQIAQVARNYESLVNSNEAPIIHFH